MLPADAGTATASSGSRRQQERDIEVLIGQCHGSGAGRAPRHGPPFAWVATWMRSSRHREVVLRFDERGTPVLRCHGNGDSVPGFLCTGLVQVEAHIQRR